MELQRAAGFGGPQPGSGRPRKPSPAEEMRRLVEDNAAAVLAPQFRTLGYEVVPGSDGVGLVLHERDGGGSVRIRCLSVTQAEEILDSVDNDREYLERLWAACIIEPAGLTVEDIRTIKATKPPRGLRRLQEAVSKLNGDTDEEEEAALKQFPEGASE